MKETDWMSWVREQKVEATVGKREGGRWWFHVYVPDTRCGIVCSRAEGHASKEEAITEIRRLEKVGGYEISKIHGE